MRRKAASRAAPPLLATAALLLALGCCFGGSRFAAALSCMCSVARCERPANCSAGVALDACSCCYECARALNETCGGLFNLLGSCANGLYCETAAAAAAASLPPAASAADGAAGPGGSSGDHDDDDVDDDGVQQHSADDYAGGGGSDFSAVAAPPEVQPGVCVPCKSATLYGCDLVVGRQCQCGNSCSKEFRFDTLEACRSAAAGADGRQQLQDDDSGTRTMVTAAPLEPFPDPPTSTGEASCDEVPCPNDSDLFVECPPDSWRRPLTEPSLFELCCGIHGMTDECVCKEPRSCPAPPMCDEGLLPIEVVPADNKPGSCCSLYQCANVTSLQCEYKGMWYDHGDEVPPASFATAAAAAAAVAAASPSATDDEGGASAGRSRPAAAAVPSSLGDAAAAAAAASCQSCFCIEGQVLCRQAVECPPVPSACSWMAVADGDCCPTCRGCVSRSTLTFHVVGESWQEDDCTHCECDVGGVSRCFASGCAAPRCARPLKLPGHCCPVCSGGEDAASADRSADASAIDDGGRVDVVTYAGSENVTDVTPHSGTATRPTVVVVVTSLPTTNASESSFSRCTPLDERLCRKACASSRRIKDSSGCPTCDCASDGESSSHNQTTSAAATPAPVHQDGITGSSRTSISPDVAGGSDGAESSRGGGARCFTSLGHPRRHGEMWFDGCRQCLCDDGRELCSLVACPPPTCRTPVQTAGQCCPVCAEDADRQAPQATNVTTGCKSASAAADGRRRRPSGGSRGAYDDDDALEESGEPWRLDACSVCICHQGRALCETERCPPVLCEKPVYISGRCCPTCPDTTQYWPASMSAQPTYRQGCSALGSGGMRTYRHGDAWRASDCQSCTCQHGQLHCFSQTCPAAGAAHAGASSSSGGGSSCSSAVLRKGQCCPICAADPADVHPRVCVVNDQVYLHGQEWTTACSICVCYHGNRHCAPRPCSSQMRGQMMNCGASHPSVYFGLGGLAPSDGVCCQHCLDAWNVAKAQADPGAASGSVPGSSSSSTGSGSEVAIIATLAALLCLFACVIVVLVVVVVRRTKRRSASVTLGSVAPELLSMTACGGSGGGGVGGSGGVGSVSDAPTINNRPVAVECALRKDGAGGGVAGMRRPKSTNLEFYVGSYRYNNTALKDKECCKPLVDASAGGGRTLNDYVLC